MRRYFMSATAVVFEQHKLGILSIALNFSKICLYLLVLPSSVTKWQRQKLASALCPTCKAHIMLSIWHCVTAFLVGRCNKAQGRLNHLLSPARNIHKHFSILLLIPLHPFSFVLCPCCRTDCCCYCCVNNLKTCLSDRSQIQRECRDNENSQATAKARKIYANGEA